MSNRVCFHAKLPAFNPSNLSDFAANESIEFCKVAIFSEIPLAVFPKISILFSNFSTLSLEVTITFSNAQKVPTTAAIGNIIHMKLAPTVKAVEPKDARLVVATFSIPPLPLKSLSELLRAVKIPFFWSPPSPPTPNKRLYP